MNSFTEFSDGCTNGLAEKVVGTPQKFLDDEHSTIVLLRAGASGLLESSVASMRASTSVILQLANGQLWTLSFEKKHVGELGRVKLCHLPNNRYIAAFSKFRRVRSHFPCRQMNLADSDLWELIDSYHDTKYSVMSNSCQHFCRDVTDLVAKKLLFNDLTSSPSMSFQPRIAGAVGTIFTAAFVPFDILNTGLQSAACTGRPRDSAKSSCSECGTEFKSFFSRNHIACDSCSLYLCRNDSCNSCIICNAHRCSFCGDCRTCGGEKPAISQVCFHRGRAATKELRTLVTDDRFHML
eukprot:Rmarinus@m.25695